MPAVSLLPDPPSRLTAPTMPEPRPKIDTTAHTLDLTGVEGPIAWASVFGNEHPVELEVGSGKGLFLQNAATACPEHNFLGVELSKKYAGKAAERLAKRQLPNVKVWPGDARLFVARHVPSASLGAVHVYFPDPWWKKRHKKRRVFTETLLADIERGLVVGGALWLATDVEEYFGVMLALVAQRPRFLPQLLPEPRAPEHDLDYLTNFERKYRIEGRPIFRAHYSFTGK
jgi:tRNA (guanine-N7-)-methyltransferase